MSLVTKAIFAALVALPLNWASVQAQEGEVFQSVQDCRTIDNSDARLKCYDTVVDGSAFSFADVRQEAIKNFGKRDDEAKSAVEIEGYTAQVIKLEQQRYGGTRLYTEDGQVWQTKENLRGKVPFAVSIQPGILGSVDIVPVGRKQHFKASRVK